MANTVDLMTYSQRIVLDDKDFNSGMTKAKSGFGKFTSSLGSFGGTIAKTVGASTLAAGAALGGFAIKGVQLASDLSEVQNVVDTTFQGNATKVNTWAKKAATSFGMSELAAKKYNGTMGAMLKSMGLTNGQVLNMSTSMVGLSGDMASFYNLDTEEAFNKIRAGISGETEPLKQLGINMSVANLNAFALSKGMSKTYDKMTQAEQATLRYNYLLSVSKDAQGDFAKTSDSMANQLRIAQLKSQDLASSFGSMLLPTVNKALGGVLDFVNQSQPAFNNLFEGFSGLLTGAEGAEEKFANGASTIINKLVDSLAIIIPKAVEILANLLPSVANAIMTNLPVLIDQIMLIIPQISETLLSMLPMILECGIQVVVSIINGLASALPQLIPQIVKTILAMVDTLLDNIDMIVDAAISLMEGLTTGIVNAIPILVEKAPEIIKKLVSAIIRSVPKLGAAAIEMVGKIRSTIMETNWLDVGWQIIKGVISGIWDGIKNIDFGKIGKSLLDGVKGVLGIHSPSTEFAKLGDFMAQGVDKGFVEKMKNVALNMAKAIPTMFDMDIGTNINTDFANRKASVSQLASSGNAQYYNSSSNQAINLNYTEGNIIIQGNATDQTIAQFRKAKREITNSVLQDISRLMNGKGYALTSNSLV